MKETKKEGRILLVGATGFVGKHVVDALAREHTLRAVVRDTSREEDVKYLKERDCEIVYGDIHDTESLEAAMQGCHTVIHLVGIIQERKGITFESVHVAGTRNIVEAAHAANIQRIVYFSALGTTPYPNNRYHKTKYEAEQLIKSSKIPFIIFRPALIAGKGDKSITLFATIIKLSPIVPVIEPNSMMQPIFVDDLIECVKLSLRGKRFLNKIFEICGPDAMTMLEMFRTVARVLGKKRLFLPLPNFAAKLITFFSQATRNPAITAEQLKMLKHPNVCDFRDVEKAFRVDFTSFKAAISTYLETK